MSRPVTYQREFFKADVEERWFGLKWPAGHLRHVIADPDPSIVALHVRLENGGLVIIRPKTPKSLTHAGARSS